MLYPDAEEKKGCFTRCVLLNYTKDTCKFNFEVRFGKITEYGDCGFSNYVAQDEHSTGVDF